MRFLSMMQQQQVQGGFTPTITVFALGTIMTAGVTAAVTFLSSIMQPQTSCSAPQPAPSIVGIETSRLMGTD
jgi:hypothetical protein